MTESTNLPDGQEERERQDAERLADHEERRARLAGDTHEQLEKAQDEGQSQDPGDQYAA